LLKLSICDTIRNLNRRKIFGFVNSAIVDRSIRVEDKAKGQKRQAPPPKPVRSNVIDLVAALQESLAQKKPRKRGAA
jgi:non-homologous end joining protein Ku